MTSTNDGKDVINIRSSGQKGKIYYIELFKSIDGGLSSDCELRERTRHLCDAWRSIHSICQQSAPSTLPHLLNWIQRHTARTVLQTEWNKIESKDENHKLLEDAINGFLEKCRVAVSNRNGVSPPWESQLVQRGKWFKQILANPWGHPVLRVLLDSEAQPPSDKEVLEWLKEERSLMFSTRLRQLAADKRCVDLALLLVSAVMDRRRATITLIPDVEQVDVNAKDKPVPQCSKPTFVDELKEAGFVQDMWELLTDMEFVLLHKRDKRARCIELAKQTPLRDGYPLVERLRSRPGTSPREKKLWKNAVDVATLIAQVIITRCMVVGRCAGLVRSVLFCCTSSLVRLLPAARLPAAAAALAAPAATARHLHTLAAAVNKQLQCTSDMKPFVCELYVRAITAAMNELERLKLKAEKEAEARGMEQMLAAWVTQLGALLAASQRLRCECALTAFSVHPSAPMYEAIRAAPPLQHKVVHESKEEQTTSEFGSWASDSRSQTNFVKTSETLNLKQTQHRANVLSTAILNEGEALGLSPELCQDITVLLSGLRLKTLTWDMDRELLLENCRTYMERTGAGTRAVTTELKYLNLDPRHFEHLPFEDEDENDIYYGIEKGYEHLVDQYQEPEDIWPMLDDPEQTESCYSTDIESKVIPRVRKKKTKKIPVIYDQEVDPLSFAADIKIKEKKKERPHSKERSKDRSTGKIKMEIPKDPLELDFNSEITNDTTETRKEQGKEKKKRGRKKKDITVKSESKPSSLSNLIGIKVTRPIDFHLTSNEKNEKPNKIPVSDSDNDRQPKSSLNSLNSEENDPNVLFDGLFSMDELKSPDRSTDKLGITKNNEAYLNNTPIVITTPVSKSVSKNVETVTNKISENSNCAPNPLPLEAKSKVTEDVKNSLAKLLQYRRDKTMLKLFEQNSSYAHPFTNSTTTINRDVGKLSTTIAKPQLSSQSSQQPLNMSNTPKVHINKRQSEQLSDLKNEIGNLMKSQISSKPVTSQYVQNVNRNIGIRLSKPVHSSRLEDAYVVQNELLQKSVSTSNEMKTQKSQNRDTATQNNFQDFLYQLQKSINAGAATDLPNVQNRTFKKEILPVSRVTPIIPVTSTIELKQHPQSSKPLAQQVKLKTVPNTFSRRSYMHKNSIMNDQKMNQIQACIEQQDQALKNPGIPLITDHNLTEFKCSKLKYLQGKDLVISRVDKSLQNSNESSQLNKKNRNPKIETAVSADHPVMSSILMQNNLINTHKTYAKDGNQTKQTQINRHRDYTKITSNKSKSELSEKDQNDLLLLLRQQRKQNATQPKFGNIGTSSIQPSQGPTTNSIIHSNKYDTAKYNQSTGDIINTPSSIQEAKATNYQNPSIKPIHTIQSSLYMGSKQKSDKDIKTELICKKNVNLQPTKSQKTEACNKIDGKRDIKEWESVLNEILSYKTPKRVPSILEIPVNKNISVYRQNQAKDILMTPLVSKSSGDPIQIIPKVKEQIKTPASKSVSNEIPIYNSRKDPQILRKSLSKSSLKDTKNKTMAQTHDIKSKHDIIKTSSTMRHANSVSMKPVQSEVPKGQFQADENKRLSQSDVSKRYNNVHKKQFTHSLPKEDDPFISGIRNSDYDLLEELMDDDLRQEIGELSDEDCYSASMSAQKDSKSFIVVNQGTISQEEKSLVRVPVRANHHQTTIKPQNLMKCYKPVISTPDTSVIIQPSTNFDNSTTKFDNTESKMMEHMSSNNKVCQLSRNITSTPSYDNNINNINSQQTTDQSNDFFKPVAQQSTLQNLVLIGSEIVYTQPCTVTQIPIANITPNTYVALNNQSNMALYQSTQFSAPVIKPLIVGNATVLPTVPVESRHSRSILKNSEVNKFSNHDKLAEHVFPAPESKFDLNLFTSGDNVNGKCHSVLESKKAMSDFIKLKNGERKVLSEVQAKLAISKKTDLKVIRNQTVLVDNDIKKEMSKDQERLKNKRMAILNRNICHRCDHKPIALTYAPIEPVSGKDQEKQVDDNSNVSCNNNSNLKIELFNRQVGKEPSLSQRNIASVISCKSINSQENFKENKTDSVACRRILLRSSNKLSKVESFNFTPSETFVNTKTRLKSNADEIKIKLKGKCNNTINHISDKRTKIKEKTLKKSISSKVKHKLKNKKTETLDQYSLGNINYYKQETIDSKSSLTEKVDVEEQLIALKIPKQILSEPSTQTSRINNQTENQILLANQNKCKLIHDSFKDNVSLQQESLEGTIAQALSEKVDVEEQLIALKIPKQILITESSTMLSTKNDQSENQISLINQNKCECVEDCSKENCSMHVEDCCKDNESLHHFLGDKNVKPLSGKIDVEEQLIAQKISKQGLLIKPSTEMCLMDNQAENQTLKFNQNVYENLYDIPKDNESLQQEVLEVKKIPALSEKVDTEDETIALKSPKIPLLIGISTKNEFLINDQTLNNDQNKLEHVCDIAEDNKSLQESFEAKNVQALSDKVDVEDKLFALKISKQISLFENSNKMSSVNNQTENQTLPANQNICDHIHDNFGDNESSQHVTVEDDIPALSAKVDEIKEKLIASKLSKQVLLSKHSTIMSQETNQTENPTLPASHKFEHIHDSFKYNELIQDCLEVGNEPVISEKVDVEEQLVALKIPKQVLLSDPSTKMSQINNQTENQTSPADQNTCEYGNNESLQQDSLEIKNITQEMQAVFNDKKGKGEDKVSITEYDKVLNLHRGILKNNDVIKKIKQHPKNKHSILPATQPSNQSLELVKSKSCKLDRGKMGSKSNKVFKDNAKNISDVVASTDKPKNKKNNEKRKLNANNSNTQSLNIISDSKSAKEINDVISVPQSYKDSIIIEEIPIKDNDSFKKCVLIKLPSGRVFRGTVYSEINVNVDTLFSDPTIRNLLLRNLTDKKRYTLNVKHPTIKNKVVKSSIKENQVSNKNDCDYIETINLLSDEEDDDSNQFLNTDYGKYKVNKTDLLKHQKRFNDKCFVKLNRIDLPQSINNVESIYKPNDITNVHSDTVCPDIITQNKETMNKLPILTSTHLNSDSTENRITNTSIKEKLGIHKSKDQDFIEIDDLSNDSPNLNSCDSSKLSMDKDKMNDLKDLLLLDLGMTEQIKDNATEKLTSEVNNINGSACQIVDSKCDQNTSIEINTVLNSVVAIGCKEGSSLFTQSCNSNCYVKLTNCDELAMKHEQIKWMKQNCFVKLVRCDHQVNLIEGSTKREADMAEEEADDIIDNVIIREKSDTLANSLSRSGSFSILNEYSALDDTHVPVEFERNTSPVIDIYEAIITLNNNFIDNTKLSLFNENSVCKSEWCMTKTELRLQNQLITNEVHRDNKLREHLTNNFSNVQLMRVICSQSACVFNAPKLTSILTKFFQDNYHIIDRFNNTDSVFTRTNMRLKRKSTTLGGTTIKRKMNKKSISKITVQEYEQCRIGAYTINRPHFRDQVHFNDCNNHGMENLDMVETDKFLNTEQPTSRFLKKRSDVLKIADNFMHMHDTAQYSELHVEQHGIETEKCTPNIYCFRKKLLDNKDVPQKINCINDLTIKNNLEYNINDKIDSVVKQDEHSILCLKDDITNNLPQNASTHHMSEGIGHEISDENVVNNKHHKFQIDGYNEIDIDVHGNKRNLMCSENTILYQISEKFVHEINSENIVNNKYRVLQRNVHNEMDVELDSAEQNQDNIKNFANNTKNNLVLNISLNKNSLKFSQDVNCVKNNINEFQRDLHNKVSIVDERDTQNKLDMACIKDFKENAYRSTISRQKSIQKIKKQNDKSNKNYELKRNAANEIDTQIDRNEQDKFDIISLKDDDSNNLMHNTTLIQNFAEITQEINNSNACVNNVLHTDVHNQINIVMEQNQLSSSLEKDYDSGHSKSLCMLRDTISSTSKQNSEKVTHKLNVNSFHIDNSKEKRLIFPTENDVRSLNIVTAIANDNYSELNSCSPTAEENDKPTNTCNHIRIVDASVNTQIDSLVSFKSELVSSDNVVKIVQEKVEIKNLDENVVDHKHIDMDKNYDTQRDIVNFKYDVKNEKFAKKVEENINKNVGTDLAPKMNTQQYEISSDRGTECVDVNIDLSINHNEIIIDNIYGLERDKNSQQNKVTFEGNPNNAIKDEEIAFDGRHIQYVINGIAAIDVVKTDKVEINHKEITCHDYTIKNPRICEAIPNNVSNHQEVAYYDRNAQYVISGSALNDVQDKTSKNEIDRNKIITVDNCIRENDSDTQNEVVSENFNHKESADHFHLHGNREYYEVVHESVANMLIKFDEKLVVHKNDHVDFQNFEVAYENVAENVEVGDEHLIIQNEVTVDCVYEVVTADITKKTNDAIETPNVSEHDYTTIPKSLKHFRRTDTVYSDLGEITSLRTVDTQDILSHFETAKSKSLCESGCSRLKMINEKDYLLKKGNITSTEEKEQTSRNGGADIQTQEIWECDSYKEKNKDTFSAESDSEIILKGLEFEDPEMGTCYVFPLVTNISESSDSDANNITDEILDLLCDEKINYDFKLNIPNRTYSKECISTGIKFRALCYDKKGEKCLKRKMGMTDIQTIGKKYRKGKGIDHPKITIAHMSGMSYTKQFKRLFDYFSTVKFSYSLNFHKESINVHNMLCNWPIQNFCNNAVQMGNEIEENLFIDIETNGKPTFFDPKEQTLAEEIRAEYDETNYSFNNINETNFDTGFGEGSDRVIQYLKGRDDSLKNSAAALSDVKQSQPLLVSEISIPSLSKVQDQIQILQRHYAHVQLRYRGRFSFRKTKAELTHDWLKENKKYYSNYDISNFPFGLNSTACTKPRFFESVVQPLTKIHGEESDRIIQNLKGDDSSKNSAEVLLDLKQSQPLLVSERTTLNLSTVKDQIEKLQRHYAHVQLRDRVRSFFKKTKAELTHDWLKDNKKDYSVYDISNFPFGLNSSEFIEPRFFETVVQVVQVGQLPVSATAQNPVTCDPRVTQVSNVSPAQCTAESSPNDDPQVTIKTEYTELTTADLSLPIVPEYALQKQTMQMESQEAPNLHMSDEKNPVETELKSIIKIEMVEETPEIKTEFDENGEINESQIVSDKDNISNADYCFSNIDTNANIAQDNTNSIFDSSEKQIISGVFPQQMLQKDVNGSLEKTDQIAHAMSAAGITTTDENITNTRAHALVNILAQKILQNNMASTPSSTNTYPKTTSINAMALQQALSQILPPPLNQTNVNDNNQQVPNSSVTPQVLQIVQSNNSSGNQITLVDNTQQSVINTSNATPVLHIVQNKGNSGPTSDGTSTPQTNAFSGLSLGDAGIQQGGNQLLHIVNTGNQKATNAGQLLKRVNLLTNLTNVQGSNEQKMVQFVCKSADGKAIQLNASHQRGMVLRLQPIETPNTQNTQAKPVDAHDISPTNNTNNDPSKEIMSQQEIKSRSIYEENYAKFIQNSSNKTTVLEKSTSLPKFNQAFGKQVFQDSNQNQHDMNNSNSHVPSVNSNNDSTECQSTDNAINLEHISQISSPPLLLRKSPAQTSQAQTNLVQQIKQTMAPMNVQTMHGGVIYTRQIPVNIGGGQTINLITVPSTELIDDPTQKQQTDVKFVNQGEMEPSIIKIVPQTSNSDVSNDENNTHAGASNENPHTPQSQPPPVLTQMRIKLPMLSKAPQMVSGARVVRPSFFQIQRNVIGGGNQPVYQQLVLTAAPPLGQQTIRLPQAPASRQIKVPSENHSSSESQMSSSTLEQLREFDLVLEQVKERSTVQPNTKSNGPYSKLHAVSNDTTDGTISASTTSAETTQQVLYSVANTQPVNVAYVNRKATISTSVCSPDSSGAVDSSTTSTHTQHRRHTVTSDLGASETPPQSKPTKVSSKSRSRPKASSNPLNTLKLNSVPPKTSTQKPVEDEQTTQRILYILAEYREQVENSPDKDKPAPRRRSNPPLNPSGSSKRKKSSSSSRRPGGRDISPVHGEDTCRTMGSEDSSCGTSQGDCNESCLDSHSPQNSPRKIVRKLTFENEMPITQPRPQPQRNVIVADGQTITVARGTAGKPATAVLMPANYILPVSLVKGGQQIAIVTNRGPKLLTVGGGEGGATNALLLQRLIGPAGLKPILTRPGVRHIRLPTAALHNLQAFNLATNTTVQPSDSTASSTVSAPTPPELVKTRADSSAWTDRDCQDVKPERASSPECSEPWNLPSSADPHDYIYEETVRADNMNRTVLEPIPDRYSPDMEAQRIFDKMFDVDSKRSYMVDSPRCGYDIDASDCDDKAYHQVVHRKDGSSHRQHRLTHVSAAALRHKYAILEHELRLQKSLSEECEDLGVDSPSASELFPEAELLFAASPAHDHTPDQAHHSHTPQPTVLSQSGMPQPDIDDQIATDQLLTRNDLQDDRSDLNLGLEDVGIVTVSEDGMQATIALDQEEFARSHPNTTFHSEPTDDGEVQPYTISDLKARHITSTIFHSNRTPGTVLMTAPQTTVISQATAVSSGVQNTQNVKYSDIDNMINSLPGAHANTINLSSVLVKDDGLTRYDHILNDSRELHLSNTASAIVHSTGNATQVIKRLYYDDDKRDARYMVDEPEDLIAREDAKMIVEDSSRDATLESMADVEDYRSSPDRNTELFWESNSASERSESRRPLDFSSDSDKCCKSPSFDETNSTDSSGVGAHIRLDSVIKDARGIERSGSADGSSADDTHPPLRTYPAKRLYHHPLDGDVRHSVSGKTRAGERSPFPTGAPDTLEGRRRASARGVVKRCCHCCNGSPAPPRPKKIRPKKPTMDFINHH